ncbi:MAG: DegT/DnrJ/EryC1/StrS aminotransferase family protein [Euryarchaeota archaeon]|nr:DegT/DnrJ/EryC1/StrS aminotransferase family protein [Euryarchaeota archaeon]
MFPQLRPHLPGGDAAGDAEEEVKARLSRLLHHGHVSILGSGSCAVMAAVAAVGGKVMVPDQGGWRGFLEYPPLFGLETCTLETDMGVVDAQVLEDALRREAPEAFILTSFAGYIAEQDMREISRVCAEYGVLLIEDASGSVGDRVLADGRYSDIILGSTGSPKIINAGRGGFITCDDEELAGRWRLLARACRADPGVVEGIGAGLETAAQRVERLLEFSRMLKEELPGVVHPDRRGICVGIETGTSPRRLTRCAHRAGLVTDTGRGFLTTCPRYERFNRRGVVVELKKLDVLQMGPEDVQAMAEILKSCM